jgi:hypothetical protein
MVNVDMKTTLSQAEMRQKYQNMTTELLKLYGLPEAEAKKISSDSFEGERKIAASMYGMNYMILRAGLWPLHAMA